MRQKLTCLVAAWLLLAAVSISTADTITLVSGNAPIGERDPCITVRGAAVTVGGVEFPAADVPLQQALVINKYTLWADPVPGSQWIGVADGFQNSPPYGYIYQTSFDLPQLFSNPFMSITVAADDECDVYLNGDSLVGAGAHVEELTTFTISHGFHSGANDLHFALQNNWFTAFNPSGLTFSAQISYEVIPEPSGLFTLACGLGGLSLTIRRRRRTTLKGASSLIACLVALVAFGVTPVSAGTLTTLWIPATSADGAWTPVLQSDQEYKFVATGTYYFNVSRSEPSDAEWSLAWGTEEWSEVFKYGTPEEDVLDIVLDGLSVDWLGSTDGTNWAPHTFSPDHTYVYYYTGNGQPVHLWIADQTPYDGDYYDDNSGGLTVEIEVVPEPSGLVALVCGLSGVGAMMWRRRQAPE